jgi:hypothetical protein
MSKRRATHKPRRDVQRSVFGGFIRPRSDEAVQRAVMTAVDRADYEYLPPEMLAGFTVREIETYDLSIYETAGQPAVLIAGDEYGGISMTKATFHEFTRRAMAAGFVAALVKYRKELAAVQALSRFYSRGETGRRVSREKQTARKQTRASVAKSLAKAGHTVAEIVTHFRVNGMPKCDRSTVYRWLKVKSRAR